MNHRPNYIQIIVVIAAVWIGQGSTTLQIGARIAPNCNIPEQAITRCAERGECCHKIEPEAGKTEPKPTKESEKK